jgi:hypothetical protein
MAVEAEGQTSHGGTLLKHSEVERATDALSAAPAGIALLMLTGYEA